MSASSKRFSFARWVLCLATLALPFGAAIGCGSDETPKNNYHSCKLNSDCEGKLVCSFGLCHAQCAETDDCPAPQRCVKVSDGAAGESGTGDAGNGNSGSQNVCQLPKEATCNFDSQCK